MLRIAICEDNCTEAAQIDEMLRRYQDMHQAIRLQVEHFENAEALLAATQQKAEFDLYLLDIVMGEMDGITLARHLRAQNIRGAILFLTTSAEYAVQAFGVRAVNYLLKPIDEGAFVTVLGEVIESLGARLETYTRVRAAGGDRMIAVSSIICVEVTGHVLHYYLSDGQTITTKVLRISFNLAVSDLMRLSNFVRPHQSFVINVAYVLHMDAREFQMNNGMSVPISRLRYPEVRDAYLDYLSQVAR